MTHATGLVFASIAMCIHALMNVYFKSVAGQDFHFLVFLSLSLVFSGFVMILVGGRSHLALPAMKSPFTWFYAVAYIAQLFLILKLLQLVTATEMTFLGRTTTVVTLLAGLLILNRNTLGRGAWAAIPITAGVLLVLSGITENLGEILILLGILAFINTAKYLSMELHDVSRETKNYFQDIGVIGYILGVTGTVFVVGLFMAGFISFLLEVDVLGAPKLSDFSNPFMFINAFFYGAFAVSTLRYLEFKSIQVLKAEVIACVAALTLFMTLVFESIAYEIGFLEGMPVELDARMLGALLLLLGGSVLAVVLRYFSPIMESKDELEEVRNYVIRTTIFYKEDFERSSQTLGISLSELHDIMEKVPNLKVKRAIAENIKSRYNEHIAHADSLTGLANRLQFLTQLKAMRPSDPLALFFIDLNKFKPINDTYGHDVGDEVLKVIADRLLTFVGQDGIVTRMGGDEFCVLMRNVDAAQAKSISDDMLSLIELEVHVETVTEALEISAAIGIATYPEDINDPEYLEGLISIADKRMYEDKGQPSER